MNSFDATIGTINTHFTPAPSTGGCATSFFPVFPIPFVSFDPKPKNGCEGSNHAHPVSSQ